MALDLETIKKIDANGTNVGMIRDSAGNILWRKKYDYCSLWHRVTFIETVRPGAAPHIRTEWLLYFSSSFNALGANYYFHYGDRVDLFQSLDGTKNAVVSWYDDYSADRPEQYASFLKTAPITYTAATTVEEDFYRDIAAEGLLEAYGKIENQTNYSNYGGNATDDRACIAIRQTTDMMPVVNSTIWDNMVTGAGSHATFYNRYYDFGDDSTSAPSGNTAGTLKINVKRTTYDAPTSSYVYTITITANCKTLPAVAFSYKEESGSTVYNVGNITLVGDGSSSFTVKGDRELKFYRQSCYLNSKGSVYGTNTSPFLDIWTSAADGSTFYIPLTEVYPSKSSTNYGFLMDASGNITNSNKNVGGSFCYCTMRFQRPAARFTKLRITYTQDSEAGFDYGQFSKIDKMLCAYQTADNSSAGFGANLQHSCKGESTAEHVITYDISNLDVGTNHFINFKYHKDGSVDNGTDTFKISKIEFLEDCEYALAYDNIKNTYGLTVRNNGKEMVEFDWHWFYIDGSSEDYTLSDAPSLSADIPAGGTTTMWLTDFAIPEQSGMIAGIFECNGALHMFIQ